MLTTGYFFQAQHSDFLCKLALYFWCLSPERSVDASSERDFNGFMVHFFPIISIFSEIYERKNGKMKRNTKL